MGTPRAGRTVVNCPRKLPDHPHQFPTTEPEKYRLIIWQNRGIMFVCEVKCAIHVTPENRAPDFCKSKLIFGVKKKKVGRYYIFGDILYLYPPSLLKLSEH